MANTTPSPNMSMPVPVVGVDPGPQWAQDVNNCLTILDSHDHTPGYGVPVPPSGLNINADLPINDNNLITIRSLRFQIQPGLLAGINDIGCLYESGVDLYYNDGVGNQVRLTQAGGVAGTPGSISNLVPPASAAYVSADQTFVWQSAANTAANMDAASYIFRNATANSFGLTLSPPLAMGDDFALTLPNLPATTLPMFLGSTGIMSTGKITTAVINDGAVTKPKLAALGQQVSSSCGTFVIGSSFAPVTNLSVTITTTGRPVMLMLQDDGAALSGSGIEISGVVNGNVYVQTAFYRDATQLSSAAGPAVWANASNNAELAFLPPSANTFFDTPAAGTYTYTVQMTRSGGGSGGTALASFMVLVAYEL